MKKFFIFLTASLIAVSVMAQDEILFEKGTIRVGGASNLNFTNLKIDGADYSTNTLMLGVDAGYFVMDNLSIDVDVSVNYQKEEDESMTQYTIGAGARYWFPAKFFVGGGVDLMTISFDGFSESGTGLKLKAGLVHFLGDRFAIEPVVGYRLGLTDKDKYTKQSGFFAQFGISVFF